MRKRCNISDIEKAAKRDCENRLLIAHDAKKKICSRSDRSLIVLTLVRQFLIEFERRPRR